MNQEIQQGTTENKKPRMYVSWVLILIDYLVVATSTILFLRFYLNFIINNVLGAGKDAGGFVIIVLVWFALATIILLILSFYEKPPIGYLRTKIVDSTIVIFGIIFILSLFNGVFIVAYNTIGAMVAMAIGIIFSVLINHKFQKPEIELGTTQL